MFALAFLVLHIVTFGCARDLVLTKQGYVRGMRQDVLDYKGSKKTIYKFLGVPYAEKPIGDLRFKRPQPLKSWRLRIYNATYFRAVCLQKYYYVASIKTAWPGFDKEKNMGEDCLYLNIYTPSTSCKTKYPVIFYIHGGSYVAGTPIRDISPGEYLPTRDVVLVTIQYRLGPFGFFTTGDSQAPGNMGLLDQVEALKWVQQNIDGFGGDKNSVTLLGESAGGSSVGLHYLSPLSRGLFHRGIAVSGVEFSPFAYKPKSSVLITSNQMAEYVECARKRSVEKLKCLQSLPSSTILEKSNKEHANWSWSPFVDNHFLPDNPDKMRQKGQFHKLPLMSGFVSHEGSFLLGDTNITDYNLRYFKTELEKFLLREYKYTKEDAIDAYNALVFEYTPWADVEDSHRIRKKLIDMLTDYYIVAPTHAALTFHSDHGAPTYMFEFAHRSQYHLKDEWRGVVHEDTTAYKFGLPLLNSSRSKLKFDEDDRNVSDLITTIYLNFAKFGQPTPTSVYGTQWEMFNSSYKRYLKIQKNPAMTSKYHPIRMAFWNSYFPTLLPKKKPLPPSIDESKKSSVVARCCSRVVLVICIGTLVGILA